MIKLCIFRIRVRKVLADSAGKRLRAKGCVLLGTALLAHTGNPIKAGSLLPFIEQRKSLTVYWLGKSRPRSIKTGDAQKS